MGAVGQGGGVQRRRPGGGRVGGLERAVDVELHLADAVGVAGGGGEGNCAAAAGLARAHRGGRGVRRGIADGEAHRGGGADVAAGVVGLGGERVRAVRQGGRVQRRRPGGGRVGGLERAIDVELHLADAVGVAGSGREGDGAAAAGFTGADRRRGGVARCALAHPHRRRPQDRAVVLGDLGVVVVLAVGRRGRGGGAAGELRDRAVAARHAFVDRHRGGAAARARGVVGRQAERAGIGEAFAHEMAIGGQHQLRGLVLRGEDTPRAHGVEEARLAQRRAVRDQHRGAVGPTRPPLRAVVVLVGRGCDVVAALEQDLERGLVAGHARLGLVRAGGEGRGVADLRQRHDRIAVGAVAQRRAADDELAAGRRVVELADQALALHRRIQRGVVALGREHVADELVRAVVFPLEQFVGVEDVEVAAVADHAPFHAVHGEEAGVGGIEVARGGEAGLVEVVRCGRTGRGVGGVRAVEHVVVFAGDQHVQALAQRIGIGIGRPVGAGLRVLRAGAAGHHAAAVGVVGLAVQIAVVDRVGQAAGGRGGQCSLVCGQGVGAVARGAQRCEGRHARARRVAHLDHRLLHFRLAGQGIQRIVHALRRRQQAQHLLAGAVQRHGGEAHGVVPPGQRAVAPVALGPAQTRLRAAAAQARLAAPAPQHQAGLVDDVQAPHHRRAVVGAGKAEAQGEIAAVVGARRERRRQRGFEFIVVGVIDGRGRRRQRAQQCRRQQFLRAKSHDEGPHPG